MNATDFLGIVAKREEDIHCIKDTMVTKTDVDKLMGNFIDSDDIKEIVILDGQKIEAYSNIYIGKTLYLYR